MAKCLLSIRQSEPIHKSISSQLLFIQQPDLQRLIQLPDVSAVWIHTGEGVFQADEGVVLKEALS